MLCTAPAAKIEGSLQLIKSMHTAQEESMKKQGNRHHLPSNTAIRFCTIPTSDAETGNIRDQVSTSFSISAKGIFMPSVGLFSTTLRPPSTATVEKTASKNYTTGTSMLISVAGQYGQQGTASTKAKQRWHQEQHPLATASIS
ncbi:hypothetical protein Nepgr_004052 [Nepenthes gracilis]|uniref:Uncharacterized protein n=1 Tax=Nepenthes gracilis TaxID=150966 RepID=A0AAD3S0M7_NEPGR|nr:hypothetical protein Nepgr_004052 [Nepenthes gracilis]